MFGIGENITLPKFPGVRGRKNQLTSISQTTETISMVFPGAGSRMNVCTVTNAERRAGSLGIVKLVWQP